MNTTKYFGLKAQYRREQLNLQNIKDIKARIVGHELTIHGIDTSDECKVIAIETLGIAKSLLSNYYWNVVSYRRWREGKIVL